MPAASPLGFVLQCYPQAKTSRAPRHCQRANCLCPLGSDVDFPGIMQGRLGKISLFVGTPQCALTGSAGGKQGWTRAALQMSLSTLSLMGSPSVLWQEPGPSLTTFLQPFVPPDPLHSACWGGCSICPPPRAAGCLLCILAVGHRNRRAMREHGQEHPG